MFPFVLEQYITSSSLPYTHPSPEFALISKFLVIGVFSSNGEKVSLRFKENLFREISQGDDAFERKKYWLATLYYTSALVLDPKDATVFSKRSLCYALEGIGYYELALSDGNACIKLKPKWPEGFLRTGVALSLLKEFEKAEEACMLGLKLDPENVDLQNALQEVGDARRNSGGANVVSGC